MIVSRGSSNISGSMFWCYIIGFTLLSCYSLKDCRSMRFYGRFVLWRWDIHNLLFKIIDERCFQIIYPFGVMTKLRWFLCIFQLWNREYWACSVLERWGSIIIPIIVRGSITLISFIRYIRTQLGSTKRFIHLNDHRVINRNHFLNLLTRLACFAVPYYLI